MHSGVIRISIFISTLFLSGTVQAGGLAKSLLSSTNYQNAASQEIYRAEYCSPELRDKSTFLSTIKEWRKTEAHSALVDCIRDYVTFETLERSRANSATGGAKGISTLSENVFTLCDLSGELVATGVYKFYSQSKFVELLFLVTSPNHLGKYKGKAAIRWIARKLLNGPSRFIELSPMGSAESFYLKMGFVYDLFHEKMIMTRQAAQDVLKSSSN